MTGRVQRAIGPAALPGTVFVGDGSRWATPFPIEQFGDRLALNLYRLWATDQARRDPHWLEPLQGKNLACWCRPGQPCHADVLLDLLRERKP